MSEEENCTRVIASSLLQLSRRLNGLPADDLPQLSGAPPPQVTPHEGAEFIDLYLAILNSPPTRDFTVAERLRFLLFETSPQIFETIVSLLQVPQFAAAGDPLTSLLVSAIKCIAGIVILCCCGNTAAAAAAPELQTDDAVYLSQAVSEKIVRLNVVPLTASLIAPMFSLDIQYAASETLLALLIRCAPAAQVLGSPAQRSHLRSLIAVLGGMDSGAESGGGSPLRKYVGICLRELANTQPACFLEESTVDALTRLISLDPAVEIRAVAAETLHVVFRTEPSAWPLCATKKELATALVDRIEREDSADAMEATLKLVETLLISDNHLKDQQQQHQQQQPHVGEDAATFTEYFLSLYGDRSLVAILGTGISKMSSLAARTLRFLVQFAPFYRYVGYNLFRHFPSLSTLLKSIVSCAEQGANTQGGSTDAVICQILRVEISIALSLTLAQDPRCRQLLSSQLMDQKPFVERLRGAVLGNLNSASIEYYGGIGIVDVLGTFMNNPDAVDWEEGNRPTRESIQRIFSRQEKAWAQLSNDQQQGSLSPGRSHQQQQQHRMPPPNLEDVNTMQVSRLTFIVLSFAAHATMQLVGTGAAQASAQHRDATHQQSSHVLHNPIGGDRGGEWDQQQQQQQHDFAPHPTRTTILREMRSHPEKYEAIKKAAHLPDTIDPSFQPQQQSSQQQLFVAGGGNNSNVSRLVGSAQHQGVSSSSPPGRQQRNTIFSKFDAALKLTSHFAQYYNRQGDPRRVVYEATQDGAFARRQPRSAPWYAGPTMKTKSWTLQQLKEGDLFYFSIPFVALSFLSLEQVRSRANRHMTHVKKSFVITPQAAKARRWFLFDMVNHVMPGIITSLTELIELCTLHGEENVKFPIVMFRDREIIAEGGDAASLHSGNVLEIIDQVRFYFQNNPQPTATATPTPARGGSTAASARMMSPGSAGPSSQYLSDLERKIKSLQNLEFSSKEAQFIPAAAAAGYESDGKDSDEVSVVEPMGRRPADGTALFDDDASEVSSIG